MKPSLYSFQQNKDFSEQTLNLVKRLLGQYCWHEAGHFLDTKKATDLVQQHQIPRLAVRTRRSNAIKYRGEITIRYQTINTPRAEWIKIYEGNASHMFYGILNEYNKDFLWWVLCDLDVFRGYLRNDPLLVRQFSLLHNTDGQTCFYAIPLRLIPKCVIYSSVFAEQQLLEAACP